MKRKLQGRYVTISTVGEKARAFVPAPLPPCPPIATSGSLVAKTGITPATVNKALGHLGQLGIVRELTAQKRNRMFSYAQYIEIISRGTEPHGNI